MFEKLFLIFNVGNIGSSVFSSFYFFIFSEERRRVPLFVEKKVEITKRRPTWATIYYDKNQKWFFGHWMPFDSFISKFLYDILIYQYEELYYDRSNIQPFNVKNM